MVRHIRLSAVLSVSALALAACATAPTPYAPIGNGKLGFYEQPIEDDRFRVTFVGQSETEARDLALLRAAEIAKSRGYSHFEVLFGATEGADARRGGPRTSVGVGVGSGGGYYGRGRRTNVGVGVGFDLGNVFGGSRGRVAHSIEVKLRQSGGTEGNVFSADGVLESLGGRAEMAG